MAKIHHFECPVCHNMWHVKATVPVPDICKVCGASNIAPKESLDVSSADLIPPHFMPFSHDVLVAALRRAVIGRKVVEVGYIEDKGAMWPVLILEDGSVLKCSGDEEGTRPGVLFGPGTTALNNK